MFQLPQLPYDFGALEPHIDEETMRIHYEKHHQGYVDKLNKALEGTELENKSIEDILGNLNSIPSDIKNAVINNGGGHYNHSLFWNVMSPDGGTIAGKIKEMIDQSFGSFSEFQNKFSDEAVKRFGSGWVWLIKDGDSLAITSTANQDTPLSDGKTPILGLDVWEHAYYLKYQNKRPDYVTAWFNVINWPEVDKRLSN